MVFIGMISHVIDNLSTVAGLRYIDSCTTSRRIKCKLFNANLSGKQFRV